MGWTSAESGDETWSSGSSDDYIPVKYYEVKNPKKYYSRKVEFWDGDIAKNLENRIFDDFFGSFDLSLAKITPKDFAAVAGFFNTQKLDSVSLQNRELLSRLGCDAKFFDAPDIDKLAETEQFSYLREHKDLVKKEISFAAILQKYAKWELSARLLEDSPLALDLRLYCMQNCTKNAAERDKVYFYKFSSGKALYKNDADIRKYADFLLENDGRLNNVFGAANSFDLSKILNVYTPEEAAKFFRNEDFQHYVYTLARTKTPYITAALSEIPDKNLKKTISDNDYWLTDINFNEKNDPADEQSRQLLKLLSGIWQKVGYVELRSRTDDDKKEKILTYMAANGFAAEIARRDMLKQTHSREQTLAAQGYTSYSIADYFELRKVNPEKAENLLSEGFNIADKQLRHEVLDSFAYEYIVHKNPQALQFTKEILQHHPLEEDAKIRSDYKVVLVTEDIIGREHLKDVEFSYGISNDILDKAYEKGIFKFSAKDVSEDSYISKYCDLNERWKDNRGGLTSLLDAKLKNEDTKNVTVLLNHGADINLTVERVNKDGRKFPTKAFTRYIDGKLYFGKTEQLEKMLVGVAKGLDKEKLGLMERIFKSLPYKTQENPTLKQIKQKVTDIVADRRMSPQEKARREAEERQKREQEEQRLRQERERRREAEERERIEQEEQRRRIAAEKAAQLAAMQKQLDEKLNAKENPDDKSLQERMDQLGWKVSLYDEYGKAKVSLIEKESGHGLAGGEFSDKIIFEINKTVSLKEIELAKEKQLEEQRQKEMEIIENAKAQGCPSNVEIPSHEGFQHGYNGWVVTPEGETRPADSNPKRLRVWKQIMPGEVVLKWELNYLEQPHEFEVLHMPAQGLTSAQKQTIMQLENDIHDKWQDIAERRDKTTPGVGMGWNLSGRQKPLLSAEEIYSVQSSVQTVESPREEFAAREEKTPEADSAVSAENKRLLKEAKQKLKQKEQTPAAAEETLDLSALENAFGGLAMVSKSKGRR